MHLNEKINVLTAENARLQGEVDALAAQFEALRDSLDKIANWTECTAEFRINYGSNGERDFYRRVAADALAKTPQHHLREVRAEAGRAGYIAGATDAMAEYNAPMPFNLDRCADQYAASIRNGKDGE